MSSGAVFFPAGLHSSYAGHGVQIDPELRAALSPDCHMTPVFDERSFQSPLFQSPTQDPQGSLYRTNTGAEPQRDSSDWVFGKVNMWFLKDVY